MIQSFRDAATAELFEARNSRRLGSIVLTALRKLDMLYAAEDLKDLRTPPGNRLEALRKDRKGQHSIRINDQYRICFCGAGTELMKSRLLTTIDGEEMALIHKPTGGWSFGAATTHPGVVLEEEFLKPLDLTRHKLALAIRVPPGRIGLIVEGRRGVTPDTALRLARYFGTSPEFWLNLQLAYDLSRARVEIGGIIQREVNAMVE